MQLHFYEDSTSNSSINLMFNKNLLEDTSLFMKCRDFGKVTSAEVKEFVESKGFEVLVVNKSDKKLVSRLLRII